MIDYDVQLNQPIIDVFGKVATVNPVGGGMSFAVDGVFNDEYYEADVGAGLESSAYSFGCKLADYPDPKQDDELTLGGVVYLIANVRPNPETGWLEIQLHRKLA